MDHHLLSLSSNYQLLAPSSLRQSGCSSYNNLQFQVKQGPFQYPHFRNHSQTQLLRRTNGQISRLSASRISDFTQPEPGRPKTVPQKMFQLIDAIRRLFRPYVPIYSTIGYIGIMARTWMEHPQYPLGWLQLQKALGGLVAFLCVNGYFLAINDIFDVEIDRINKPHLVIASGDLSIEQAWWIIASFAMMVAAIAGVVIKSGAFFLFIFARLFLATIYSAPPFSYKRSTLGALVTFSLEGGFFFGVAASAAATSSLGLPFELSLPVIFISTCGSLYGLGLGILKDLGDIEGDRKYNVPTVAVTIGARKSAFIGIGLLLLNYFGVILAAIFMPQIFRRSVVIPVHITMALCLIFQAWKLDRGNYKKEESRDFFQFIWKLMCLEFFLFPFF